MPAKTKTELLLENERLQKKVKRLEKKIKNLNSNEESTSEPLDAFLSEFIFFDENLPSFIAHVDLKFRYIFVNKKYEESLGIPREKIIGKHLKDVIGSANYEIAKKYLHEAKKGNKSSYINQFELKEGPRWLEVHYLPQFNDLKKVNSIIVFAHDITENKSASDELIRSEKLLRKIQKVANLGSYVFDIKNGSWVGSETLEEIMGLSPERKRDVNTWIELVHPDDREEMLPYFLEYVLKNGNRFEREYRILRLNDHEVRWVYGLGELEFDDNKNPVKMIGTIQDITERKLVELSLAESEELHRKLISTLPDLIVRTNLSGKITYVNNQLFELSGIKTVDEIIGKNIFSFIAPEDKKRAMENTKLMFEEKLGPREYCLVFGNGTKLECEVNGDVLRSVDGTTFGMVYTIRDVTERNRISEALRNSEILYRNLIEFAVDGILLGSPDGTIIGANTYMQRLAGRSLDELVGNPVEILFSEKELKEKPLRYDLLLKGEFVKNERNILLPDGNKVPIEMNTKIMPDGNYQSIFRDISERRQAEEAITESREKYRALSEASFDSIFITENEICIEQNATAREVFGYSDEEAIGRSIKECFLYSDREMVEKQFKSECEEPFEVTALRKNGTTFSAMIRSKKMFYKGKKVWFISLTDITKQKKSEEELRQNERYLRKAEEVAKFGNWIFNFKDKMMRASEGAKIIYGLTKNEMPITDVQKVPLLQYRPLLDEAMKKLIENGERYDIDFKIRKPVTGEIVDIRSKAEFDQENMIVFGVIQDVTEQKQWEKIQREREKFLETLIENLPAVIQVKEAKKFTYTRLNKAGENLLGFSAEELIGKSDSEIYPQELAEAYLQSDQKVIKEKKLVDLPEVEVLTSQNELRILHVKKIPLFDSSGEAKFILGIAEDITERIVSEKALLKAKEDAEKSDRLKSEFLAQMSHEIRTPISTMLNFVSLIKMQIESAMDEELESCFGSIDLASKRVIRTIDMILNMSEIQTGTYENKPVKLNLNSDIFENLGREFSGFALSKGLKLIIDKPDQELNIIADEYSVMQIFANLIDNAIKYTKEGSVRVKFAENKRKLTVLISDTGIGISSEYIPHLFDAFSQEEQGYTRNFEGNGLGLALVKKYCEMNNAEIGVKSTKGKGTTFKVEFYK